RAPKRARQIVRRCEGCRCGVDATGEPRRNLLQQPAVAIRISKRSKRAVAATIRIWTADPNPTKHIRFVWTNVDSTIVEHLTDLNATTKQLVARGLDVGDDQIQTLCGAR